MPVVHRVLQLLAILVALATCGAPAWAVELLKDDCADECTDEPEGCPSEGCGDCSVLCSSCPRVPGAICALPPRIAPAVLASWWIAGEPAQQKPTEPPPKGVFHPPRRAV